MFALHPLPGNNQNTIFGSGNTMDTSHSSNSNTSSTFRLPVPSSQGFTASSPIRGASSQPRALSPLQNINTNHRQGSIFSHLNDHNSKDTTMFSSPLCTTTTASSLRAIQSSPIQPVPPNSFSFGDLGPMGGDENRFSRFAGRQSRPNPVVKGREDRRETRRKLFLANVKSRREEGRWEKRGGDDGILKLDYLATTRAWRLEKEAQAQVETLSLGPQIYEDLLHEDPDATMDMQNQEEEAMLEALALEEAEMESLVSTYHHDQENSNAIQNQRHGGEIGGAWGQQERGQERREAAPEEEFGDDGEYDSILMDFVAQEQGGVGGFPGGGGGGWGQGQGDVDML